MLRIFHLVFAFYWVLIFALCSAIALLLVAIVPGLKLRRLIAKIGAAAIFVLTGMGIKLRGLEHLPEESCVVVANHASYLDGVIMTAALPARFAFVIKHDMQSVPLAGFFLRRIGSHFVDRTSKNKSASDARQILKSAKANVSLGIFPEGTFQREPGLQPFRPGAFRIAARAGLAVIPAVIRGSRAILPDGAFLPKPGSLVVELCPAVVSDDPDTLAMGARAAILEHLDEPDLTAKDAVGV